MSPEIIADYIRDEQSYYLATGCPRTFGELAESFRMYWRALKRADWSMVK